MSVAAVHPAPRLAPNGIIGMAVFLATEVMLFAGMLSAFMILRAGAGMWPPPGQPRLPVEVTFFNTLILLASGVAMWSSISAARSGETARLERRLSITGLLGFAFLAIQGTEWVRLLHAGLSIQQSLFGATFLTVIGTHAVHVLAGVLGLVLVLRRAGAERYTADDHTDVIVAGMFWGFVVVVWPLLYVLVYLG